MSGQSAIAASPDPPDRTSHVATGTSPMLRIISIDTSIFRNYH
jgi:hypothetical protein